MSNSVTELIYTTFNLNKLIQFGNEVKIAHVNLSRVELVFYLHCPSIEPAEAS